MLRKILLDPSFWLLILINALLIYNYNLNPKIFTTLIWLYWTQSIIFGFFNFMEMVSATNVNVTSVKSAYKNNKSNQEISTKTGCFFLFHFGFFHFVYFIFLIIYIHKSGPFQWAFYEKYVLCFLGLQIVNFIQFKKRNKYVAANIGKMFIFPYLRVIPMHLCILLPAFLPLTSLNVFLVLKLVADVSMYILTTDFNKNNYINNKTNTVIHSSVPD